jgi:hypothetical protein
LVQNKKSRDAEIKFTWELFLHVAEVHICFVIHENTYPGHLGLHPNDQKTRFFPFLMRSIILVSGRNRNMRYDVDKESDTTILSIFNTVVLNDPLVVTHFIETMDLLHMRGPKSTI